MPFPFNIQYGGDAAIQPSPLLNQFSAQLERRQEERKALGTQAKAFEALLGSLPEADRPLDIEAFKLLSAGDKVAVGTGLLQAQGYRKAQAELGMQPDRAALLRGQVDELRAGASQRQAETRVPVEILRNAYDGVPMDLPDDWADDLAAQQSGLSPAALSLLRGYSAAGAPVDRAVLGDLLQGASGRAGGTFFERKQFGKAQAILNEKGEKVPGQNIVVTGPNTSAMVADNAEPPKVFVDETNNAAFYNTGKGWKHLPLKQGLSDLDRIAATASVKAVLDSPRAMGWTPEQRQAAVDEIIGKFGTAGAGGKPAAPAAAAKEPTVTSKAEYDKLPAGAIYIGKDGRRYRKP